MTKQDLVNKVAESGITKKQAGAAVDAVVEAIKGALAAGDTHRPRWQVRVGSLAQRRSQS